MEDTESCSSRQSERSPAQNRKRRQKVEVFNEVLHRLRELDVEEAAEPGFEDNLWAHFSMLPHRYTLDVNTERAEDVLLHKKLLYLARDPLTRPAVDVRLVQARSTSNENPGDAINSSIIEEDDAFESNHSYQQPAFGLLSNYELAFEANCYGSCNGDISLSRNSRLSRPLHEITISTKDKPKLLSELTCLMSELGLNIQEAHAFCSIDGYSLDIFVVDGWEDKGLGHLRNILVKEILKIEARYDSCQMMSFTGGQDLNGNAVLLKHVEIPFDENDEWEIDSNMLNFEYKIASGHNGDLYKGLFHSQDVAIKVLETKSLNRDMQREFTQEVYILRKVRHKNVVQFIGACTKPPLLCIVTEFMCGGSVYDFLHKQKKDFKLQDILKIAVDVSNGMSYLHQNNIIHRDLKAANLLIDENDVVKVADFGVARIQLQSGIMTAETGTYRWMAPEVIGHKPYNHKADVFSFGIVLWELLTRKLPYAHLTPLQAAVGVVQKGLRPAIPKNTHPQVAELLERCWQQEPHKRPDFSELVEIFQDLAAKIYGEERAMKKRNLGESC